MGGGSRLLLQLKDGEDAVPTSSEFSSEALPDSLLLLEAQCLFGQSHYCPKVPFGIMMSQQDYNVSHADHFKFPSSYTQKIQSRYH